MGTRCADEPNVVVAPSLQDRHESIGPRRDTPVLDHQSRYEREVTNVACDERASELQNGGGDSQVHGSHLQSTLSKSLETVDAGFVEWQNS